MNLPAQKLITEEQRLAIQAMTLSNFKGIKSFALDAQGANVDIYGDNASGKTKLGIMPVDTVAILAQRGIISEFTVNVYWQQVRKDLNFKREKPRYLNRSHKQTIYSQ
jgi:AAA15 family ATPase/GTPase